MQTDGSPEDDRPDIDSDVLTQRDIQMHNDPMPFDQEIIQNNNQLRATTIHYLIELTYSYSKK
jgi:hypothetical protein